MTSSRDNPVNSRRLKLIKIWYLLGGFMLLMVGIVSLMPVPDVGVNDKVSHLATYLFLGGWFSLLAINRAALVWTILGLLAYGMLLEVLQGMTAHRYAEWGDVLANASGIVAGALFYFSPLPRLLQYVDNKLVLAWSR